MSLRFQTRPLYLQVRDAMLEKIRTKEWSSGAQIPNEQELAEEFQVSQGTIRKSLSVLEREHMVRREQGRGTYVTPIDSQQMAFRFYAIKGYDGFPTTSAAEIEVGQASELEQERLALHPAHKVVRINRLRLMNDEPFMVEKIVVPERLFPDLADDPQVPSFFLLTSFEKSGLIPKSAKERVTAISADADLAKRLSVPEATALLKMDRVVCDMNDKPFEFRVRICHLGKGYYEASLP